MLSKGIGFVNPMPTHPCTMTDLICNMRNLLVNDICLATDSVVILQHIAVPGRKIANYRLF